jgi:hypothetical protein
MDELQEKIARLPAWARAHIRHLEIRSEPAVEAAVIARRELEVAKKRLREVQSSNEALLEIIRCAGKGGLDWAKVVIDTLDSYEIYRSVDDQGASK